MFIGASCTTSELLYLRTSIHKGPLEGALKMCLGDFGANLPPSILLDITDAKLC